jgi:hypothetical protein
MQDSVAVWQEILLMPDLLRAAAELTQGDVASVARLRKQWTAEQVTAALELAAGRRAAAVKFPGLGDTLLCDRVAAEQATSLRVGAHKAARFASLAPAGATVLDLCCGMGGDAMALQQAGLNVHAIDMDPLKAWMAEHNAKCPAAVADVTTLDFADRWVHLDPSRRSEDGRRAWTMEDYQPGLPFIEQCLTTARGAAVKLGPGVDLALFDELPCSVEMISEAGKLVQAVAWSGALRHGEQRIATRLEADGSACVLAGDADVTWELPTSGDGAVGEYVFTIDPAVERAGLLGVLCDVTALPMLHTQLGLLTGDEPVSHAMLTRFRVHASMPWRAKKVRNWLGENDGGIIEVKTRGQAVDTDRTQRELRGKGDKVFTVFVLRRDRELVAIVTTRDEPTAP